jgi:ribosomal protein L40E
MKLEYIKHTLNDYMYEIVAKYSDEIQDVSSFALVTWDSDMTTENLQSNKSDSVMINLQPSDVNPESKVSEPIELKPKSISNFAEFQNANIARLSEAINGKSAEEAIAYLNSVQEAFAFEIWERKEKSWAAETLKSQIKKSVEAEKGKILPDYNPANLSKTTRTKKAKTSSEQNTDKTIALFMKLGISEDDAKAAIAKTIADTFKMSSDKVIPDVESKPKFNTCSKCKALNPIGMNECMICKSNLRVCEYCDSITIDKDSKTCETHKSENKK